MSTINVEYIYYCYTNGQITFIVADNPDAEVLRLQKLVDDYYPIWCSEHIGMEIKNVSSCVVDLVTLFGKEIFTSGIMICVTDAPHHMISQISKYAPTRYSYVCDSKYTKDILSEHSEYIQGYYD